MLGFHPFLEINGDYWLMVSHRERIAEVVLEYVKRND
jgi:hypothetical protein